MDPVRRCRRVHLVGSLVSADPTARRAPTNEWLPLLFIGAFAFVAWLAPTISSWLWSSTDWHAGRDLKTLVSAYGQLFTPEQITGSGLAGRRFAYTTIAVAVLCVLAAATVTARFHRRRRHAERGLAHGSDLDRFSRRSAVNGSEQILGRTRP